MNPCCGEVITLGISLNQAEQAHSCALKQKANLLFKSNTFATKTTPPHTHRWIFSESWATRWRSFRLWHVENLALEPQTLWLVDYPQSLLSIKLNQKVPTLNTCFKLLNLLQRPSSVIIFVWMYSSSVNKTNKKHKNPPYLYLYCSNQTLLIVSEQWVASFRNSKICLIQKKHSW